MDLSRFEFPDVLDYETWSARRAAAAAPHASPSLIAAALPVIAPHCTCRELVRLTAACHELRKVEQLPIDFSAEYKKDTPSQFIRFIKQHGRRFLVSKLTTWCLQADFDWILKSAIGLQKLKCTSANRAMVSDDKLRITNLDAVPLWMKMQLNSAEEDMFRRAGCFRGGSETTAL